MRSPVPGTNTITGGGAPRPESYERRCVERWFVLLDHMQIHRLQSAVYLDSDCALSQSPHIMHMAVHGCDVTLDIGAALWVNPKLLKEFVRFTFQVYCQTPYNESWADAFRNSSMNDMVLWSAFKDASGPSDRSTPYWVPHYSAGNLSTLDVRGASHDKWRFCSLQGSETNHQHRQRGFHYDSASGIASVGNRSLVYLHFQGSRKGDIARFSRSPVTTAGAVACEHLPSLLCRAWGELENRIAYAVDPYRRRQRS
jgi:hypothetical protein